MAAAHVVLGVFSPFLAVFLLFLAIHHCRNRSPSRDEEHGHGSGAYRETGEEPAAKDELITFPGGEDLTAQAIMDAPGEVVGKSSHGTLYRAWLGAGCEWSPVLLRFVRPVCAGAPGEAMAAARLLGSVRHPNLVPLRAHYVGSRGENLLVHPFFPGGTLFHFLQDGNVESHKWEVVHMLSLGIASGLDHLHNGLKRPLIHGNLKSKNILLDADRRPRLSDFGLHLLLNPSSAQEMLESSAAEGYKAPEVIKMKEASKESDIYSLGVILLEMVTRNDSTSGLLPTMFLHLPNFFRNSVLDCRIPEVLSPGLTSPSEKQNCILEEGLLMLLQLAIMCCTPSPSSRPDIKQVLKKLEEIGRQ